MYHSMYILDNHCINSNSTVTFQTLFQTIRKAPSEIKYNSLYTFFFFHYNLADVILVVFWFTSKTFSTSINFMSIRFWTSNHDLPIWYFELWFLHFVLTVLFLFHAILFPKSTGFLTLIWSQILDSERTDCSVGIILISSM